MKIKLLIGTMCLSFLALAGDKKGPTAEEKLNISQLVNQYLQQKQVALDAQMKASALIQQIISEKNKVEDKYKCTYNLDTNECVEKK